MNTVRKLLAFGALAAGTFAFPTNTRAEDCYLHCASWACDVCKSCNNQCWSDSYWACVEKWCS